MIPTCRTVTIAQQARRKRRGSQAVHTRNSSITSVASAVAAWKACGSWCAYQPIQVGSGPFS